MRLYLMRHGIAVDGLSDECPTDADRYLTEEGIAKTRDVARGLKTLGVKFTHVFASPYVRAVETAGIVCDELGFEPAHIHTTRTLVPEASPGEFLEELLALPASSNVTVLCVGHAPSIDGNIAGLLGIRGRFVTATRKAGVACFDDVSPSAARGELEWVMTPKALRLLGGASD